MNDQTVLLESKKELMLTDTRRIDPSVKEKLMKLMKSNEVEFVDLRFTDLRGKEQHVTLPQNKIDEHSFFKYGKAFDGSSICWLARYQ